MGIKVKNEYYVVNEPEGDGYAIDGPYKNLKTAIEQARLLAEDLDLDEEDGTYEFLVVKLDRKIKVRAKPRSVVANDVWEE